MDSSNSVFILIDNKLNAILGVFSTQERLLEAKKAVIKRDALIIKSKVEQEITTRNNMSEERKKYNVGILNLISFLLADIDNRFENVVLSYEGLSLQSRYLWYRTQIDNKHFDQLYGPLILLHPPMEIMESEIIN